MMFNDYKKELYLKSILKVIDQHIPITYTRKKNACDALRRPRANPPLSFYICKGGYGLWSRPPLCAADGRTPFLPFLQSAEEPLHTHAAHTFPHQSIFVVNQRKATAHIRCCIFALSFSCVPQTISPLHFSSLALVLY